MKVEGETTLDTIAEIYLRAGMRDFAVQISPSAQPADLLPAWLAERRLVYRDNWAKVCRMPNPNIAVSTDFTICCAPALSWPISAQVTAFSLMSWYRKTRTRN